MHAFMTHSPMSAALAIPPHTLSIVVPVYNEEDNVAPLVKRVHEALTGYENPWELLLVDDGSSDSTVDRGMQATKEYGAHVRIVALMRNFKQTAAMQAGSTRRAATSSSPWTATCRTTPSTSRAWSAACCNEDLDLVAGWRKNRKDGMILRKIPSKIANRLIARITGVHLQDYGCSA
jgi:glycosyltransferase involved in cell wall biosynthesis